VFNSPPDSVVQNSVIKISTTARRGGSRRLYSNGRRATTRATAARTWTTRASRGAGAAVEQPEHEQAGQPPRSRNRRTDDRRLGRAVEHDPRGRQCSGHPTVLGSSGGDNEPCTTPAGTRTTCGSARRCPTPISNHPDSTQRRSGRCGSGSSHPGGFNAVMATGR